MTSEASQSKDAPSPIMTRVAWKHDADLLELRLRLMETIALQHHPVLLELHGYEGVPNDVLLAVTEAEEYARSQGKKLVVRVTNRALREAILAKFQESVRQRDAVPDQSNSDNSSKEAGDEAGGRVSESGVGDSRAATASKTAIQSMLNAPKGSPQNVPKSPRPPKAIKKKSKKKRSTRDYAILAGVILLGTGVLGLVEYQLVFNSKHTPVSMPKKVLESNELDPAQLQAQIELLNAELESSKRDLANARHERDVLKEALRITRDSR